MRHSEAAEEDEEKKKYRRDIDRPLTERGITYAKKLSENLKTICGEEWMPTRALCSSARRTRETLMAMDLVPTMSIFNDKVSSSSSSNNNTVVYLGSIYHYAGMDGVFGSHVKQLIIGESETFEGEQTDEVVLIVGHNRGLEEAVREFTGETNVEMNVASLACLRKRKEAKTRETWEQALEEKDDPNDPKKSSLWTLEHLLDPNGQCLDCGWGDVPRG
jgi:phosphohistidine phosphatase SixA